MTLSGNIDVDRAKHLVQMWFGDIEKRDVKVRALPVEPIQQEARHLTVTRNVPYDALYKTWHIPNRLDKNFYVCDLITDLLSGGKSARLYQDLVKEKKLFSDISAFVSGDVDPGLIILGGKVMKGISLDEANKAVDKVLQDLMNCSFTERELKKVQNKYESNILMGQTNVLNKAMDLSYFEMLGDAEMLNHETEKYCAITPSDIAQTAKEVFKETNCSTLYYVAEKEN
jgi:predicted Zn-dependent peptidase